MSRKARQCCRLWAERLLNVAPRIGGTPDGAGAKLDSSLASRASHLSMSGPSTPRGGRYPLAKALFR